MNFSSFHSHKCNIGFLYVILKSFIFSAYSKPLPLFPCHMANENESCWKISLAKTLSHAFIQQFYNARMENIKEIAAIASLLIYVNFV